MKKLHHEPGNSLVTARLGPGACGLVVRNRDVDAFGHMPTVASHVQGVIDHKFDIRAVGAHSESFIHLGDSNNKNIEKK